MMNKQSLLQGFDDRWSALALMRFALASIVVFSHLLEFTPLGFGSFLPMLGSFEAILGFLLISGYSIALSYRKDSDGFLLRRIRRIYPVYLTSMVIAAGVSIFIVGRWPGFWELVVNALFLNQIVTSTSFVGPAWSLSLEFWLYCLTPLLFLVSDRHLQRLIVVSFVAYVIFTCGRTLFHWNHYAGVGYGLNLLFLAFIWLAGLRLARHSENPKPVLRMIAIIFVLHILLTAAIQFGFRLKNAKLPLFFSGDIWEIALQAATLTVVFWMFLRVTDPAIKGKPSHAMRVLGDISFPLYLVHIPIFKVLEHWGVRSPILYYIAAVLAAAVIYRTVDFYSQRRPLTGGQTPVASSRGRKVSAALAVAAIAVTAIFSSAPGRTSGATSANRVDDHHGVPR
jgi:peptidoglycan/LPS O-acetylase OafA/YrhL